MRRRTVLASAALVLVAATLGVTYVLDSPQAFTERPSFYLSGSQSPPWLQGYCVPGGTLVEFSWRTSDTSSVAFEIWSTGLQIPYQYNHVGPNGSGSFDFYSTEFFGARNTTSAGVQVEVNLSFSLKGTVLSGPPAFGTCR